MLLLCTLLLPLSASAKNAPKADQLAVACNVAVAYAETVIANEKDRPIVFTMAEEPFILPAEFRQWWTADQDSPRRAKPPPIALIRRLQKRQIGNAVARCPSVRRLLESRRIKYGSKAVDAVTTSDPSEAFKAAVYTVSVPVVSADGKKAVLVASSVSGPMAAGAFLQLVERRSDDRWTVVASSLLTVS